MTTKTQDTLLIYARNTSTESYPITFEFTNFSHVKVSIGDDELWYLYRKTLVYGTDYTIEAASSGGTVKLLSPGTLTFSYICVERIVPYAQTTPLAANYAAYQLDSILNNQEYQIQQLAGTTGGIIEILIDTPAPVGRVDYLPKYLVENTLQLGESIISCSGSAATVHGNLVVEGTFTAAGKATVPDLDASGDAKVGGNLDVAKNLAVQGSGTVKGPMSITGNVTAGNDLIVSNDTTTKDITVTNSLILDGITLVPEFSGDLNGKLLGLSSTTTLNQYQLTAVVDQTGGGGTGTVNVTTNVVGMGGSAANTLVDSKIKQNDTTTSFETEYRYKTEKGLTLVAADKKYSTEINTIGTQDYNVKIGLGLQPSTLSIGKTAFCQVTKISDTDLTLSISAVGLGDIQVKYPIQANGVGIWEGYSNSNGTVFILSDLEAKITENTFKGTEFTKLSEIRTETMSVLTILCVNGTVTINPLTISCIQIQYSVDIDTIVFVPNVPIGMWLDIIMYPLAADLVVNWPDDWFWAYGFAPDTSLFVAKKAYHLTICRTTDFIAAFLVNRPYSYPDTGGLTLIPPYYEKSPCIFYDFTGDFVKSDQVTVLTENTWEGFQFTKETLIRTVTSEVNNIDIELDGTLNIEIYGYSPTVFVFEHDRDIDEIAFSVDEAIADSSFVITLVKKPGSSTQTSVPLPDYIYCDDDNRNLEFTSETGFYYIVYASRSLIAYVGFDRSA